MITDTPLPNAIAKEMANLWFVFTGNGMTTHGVFDNPDDALASVHKNIATNLWFTADMKHCLDDDHSELALGAITGFNWSCPTRPMTREEVLATNSEYEKFWLKNPPMTPDFAAAAKRLVTFIGEPTSNVTILRGSRYLGYLHRSGHLNDKTQQIAELIEAMRRRGKTRKKLAP